MKKIQGEYRAVKHRPGNVYAYEIAVPEKTEAEYALLVQHDGLNQAECNVLERLAEEGAVPQCVCLGILPGHQAATGKGGYDRDMRMNDYDMLHRGYADMLVEELIPYVIRTHGLSISDDPNMHMISGGSSGGISALNAAWFRNDYFRRVYMSSPSFLAMGRGDEMPVWLRKFETKPIRIFTEYSENEPDDYFGSSLCAAMEAERALRFAGYDFACAYYPGDGHCAHRMDETALEPVMRFLWKNWAAEPVRPAGLSPRMEKMISLEHPWQETEETFPQKDKVLACGGEYVCRNGTVFFVKDGKSVPVLEGVGPEATAAVSSDLWRLYISRPDRDCVRVASICPDGSLKDQKLFCALHLAVDFDIPGATDLCVDCEDRVYAATRLGIQAIRSYGLIDGIIPLPGDAVPEKLAFGGENRQWMYALAQGKVYKRWWKTAGRAEDGRCEMPRQSWYYD